MRNRLALVAAAALTLFALSYRLHSPVLFEDPNDGQYAEVAREMLERGDWITPTLNEVVFLNKPPLLYWLIAAAYVPLGVNELAARLPGTLATALTPLLILSLGRLLFGSVAGLLAAFIYVALPSTLLEARFVRPDTLLIAATTGTLLGALIALDAQGRRRSYALIGTQVALAAGVMAKGVLAVLLPAVPIAVLLIAERRWDFARILLKPGSWLLLLLLVAPWHLIAAWRHDGFAWDYIINQHFLFFLDRKLPRDSIPVSLPVFWGALAARTFPWTLLVPVAVYHAVRHMRADPVRRRGYVLALSWAAWTLVFFSAAVSRLEHYALPALPALALLLGVFFAEPPKSKAWNFTLLSYVILLVVSAFAATWISPQVLTQVDWLSAAEGLPTVARLYFGGLGLFGLVALGLARIDMRLAPVILAAGFLTLVPIMHAGLVSVSVFSSWAPTARIVQSVSGEDPVIVFEAPTEYQTCAGLNFYLRRRTLLLRPPGFVAPTYLTPHLNELFIDEEELRSLWNRERVFFVSDPLAQPDRSLESVLPHPFYVVARDRDRWLLSNQPIYAGRAAGEPIAGR
jgi:4-amino-4-deoxy-L-arabinose transferase-like glycosyltransferase